LVSNIISHPAGSVASTSTFCRKMDSPFASLTCRCVSPAGSSKEVDIGVSLPLPHDKYDSSCLVWLPDQEEPTEIFGVDSLQSLSLAMRFAATRLDHFISQGWIFYSRDGDEEYEIDWSVYFMPQSVLDKLSAVGAKALKSIEDETEE
jgi:hypothetical protein